MSVYKYDASTNTYVLVDGSTLLGSDPSIANFSVATDLADYAPGSTANFTANVGIGDIITFNVSDTLGKAISGTSQPWTVTDGGPGDLDGLANGVIQTTWAVGQDAAGESFVLSAMDQTTGYLATTTFTDAPNNGTTPAIQLATPNPSPAALDLTTAGAQGTVGGAIFQEVTGTGTGSGSVTAFLRVNGAPNDTDGSATTEEGFNTDFRTPPKAPLDDIDSLTFTHSLTLNLVPIVTVGGVQYREFRLDLGEAGNGSNDQAYLSLDSLQVYVGGASLATVSTMDRPLQQDGTASSGVAGGTLVYDLDGGGDTWLALKDLNAGNGQTNYRVLIPDSYFTAAGATSTSDVLLYSAFGYQGTVNGISYVQDSTYEEWSVSKASATITGSKLIDADGNLQTTGDETPRAGWTIYIDANNNNQLDSGELSTTTDANGQFTFTNLAAGTYTVREVLPAGWTQLAPQSPDEFTVTVAAGGTQSGLNFINFQQFSISGTKYTDVDGHDNQAAIGSDDTVLAGVTINLYDHNGATNTDTLITSQLTGVNGSYSFTGLGPLAAGHSYFVQETLPAGDTETYGAAGYTVAATSGNTTTGENFANFQQFSISGTKYTDVDGHDNQTAIGSDDTVLAGVTINLYDHNGATNTDTLITSQLTGVNGSYSFTGLGPLAAGHSYFVQETLPAGDTETYGAAGYTVAATSGNTTTGENFANFQQFSISGTKYTDVDGHDNQAAIGSDDTVLAGVTINLYDHNGATNTDTLITSQLTGVNGSYSFTGLGPLAAGHSYFVQETLPAGDTETYGAAGYTVAATSGNTTTGEDFANFQQFSISGTKYTDVDGHDNQTAIGSDDTVLAGVTINLYDHNGATNTDTLITSQLTGVNGSYSFTGLGPLAAGHSYFVQETLPAGDTETYGAAGYTVAATSGNTTTGENFANYLFKPAATLTQGYWGSHTAAWDGNPGLGKTTSPSDVAAEANWNKTQLIIGDDNHNGIADDAFDLSIDLKLAQSLESSAKLGDPRGIMLAQLIATQLNINNDWNKYGVADLEPQKLVDEAITWLKGTGGILADGVLTNSEATVSKNQVVLGAGGAGWNGTWGSDHAVSPADGSGPFMVNGQDIANALGWFNQGQLVVSQNGSQVAWNNNGTFENVHANDLDNFWHTLSQEHLI
ncbi:hypothetical protein CK489_23540 [Bradyrhizobium sp. UFLA03-84]|uniref:beta strand repeat-containing protein n=1 Tax=Bradyrhizobium sp. UFLA03-84 TaxID=418599 RepID=UPI000BAE0704|nr:SpaA isopeptide-forming pilin-related protein [Bradyrhizobium sp. UFLA03-84]PAY05921.1 hypothetical protein CK489_23540 [Bradyrhizobium sp. UFLA03-84]